MKLNAAVTEAGNWLHLLTEGRCRETSAAMGVV